MADEDDSQKTEDPSDRKLSKAKQKGQVGTSTEVKNWAILMGGTLLVALLAPWMMSGIAQVIVHFIDQADSIPVEFGTITPIMKNVVVEVAIYLAPFFGVLTVISIIASVAQTGFMMAPEKINPKLQNVSLLGGIKRMFSMRSMVEFLKGILKLTVLSVVAFSMTIPWLKDVAVMPDFDIGNALHRLYLVTISLSAGSIIVMTVVAVLDYMYQKFDFKKSMRMSQQEVKDEYKETEGDPQVKARIRKLRSERAQQRMMANVPDADVVITNPTHFAVALSYKMDDMQAPRVVAKGMDELAFRIRDVAVDNDVPIVENPPLARALYASAELDEEIPVEHYQAVAEVIGYVMNLKGKGRSGEANTTH